MKTNPISLLLLTITLSVQSAMAGRPSAPSVKMPAMHTADRRPLSMPSMQKMRPVAPPQRAAVPSVRMIKPSVPLVRVARPVVKPSVANAPATILKPAGNGQRINLGAGRGTQTIPAAPVRSGNAAGSGPISGGLHDSLSAMQEGRAAADQLKQMKDLRSGIQQQGLPQGPQDPFSGNSGKGPHGPNQPDTDFGDDTVFTPREPSNPLDHSSEPNAGLTDIRGEAANNSKGTGDGLSARGDRIYRDGVRFFGNCDSSVSSSSGGHTTRSTLCDTGGPNGNVTYAVADGAHGHTFESSATVDGDRTRAATVERGPGGRVVETVAVTTNADGTRHKEITDSEGNVHDMGTGPAEHTTSHSCDRNPEGSSTGGPVNGKHGSLQEQLGLKPIDLLRQPNEEAQSGGTNRMTSGQLRHDQIRPTNGGETPMPGGNRNRVSSNRFGNLTNPAPGFGESTTSGNHKD